MMYSHSLPYAIKLSDLQNDAVVQALLGSDRVLPVPRVVDDIAESLRWLLEDETFPLSPFYKVVVTQLLLVCDWQFIFHVDPYDAHYTIIISTSSDKSDRCMGSSRSSLSSCKASKEPYIYNSLSPAKPVQDQFCSST